MPKPKVKYHWVLQGWYGKQFGWEDLTAEETFAEIQKRLREYRENEPSTPLRTRKKKDEATDG